MSDNRPRELLEELKVTDQRTSVSRGYTRFIRYMRFILPLAALVLIVVVIAWPEMEDKIVIVQKNEIIPETQTEIGENELLNPHFTTIDAQQQPVNVTAARALQNQENPDLVKLERPNADLKMKDGSNVQIESLQGTYEQKTEKLFLQDNVKIRHESGYILEAEELRVNMKTREAFSDKTVHVTGPDAKVVATGLEGNVESGILIFKGPATLTLSSSPQAGKPATATPTDKSTTQPDEKNESDE